MHLEQARLAHLAVRWPYLGDKALLIDLVQCAARDDLGMVMELAQISRNGPHGTYLLIYTDGPKSGPLLSGSRKNR